MFTQIVNPRSRTSMIDYLSQHFRYPTGFYANRTSYAHNVKIHQLALPATLEDKAYDLIAMDEVRDRFSDIINDFTGNHEHCWTAGFNGHTGGYLVLYACSRNPDPHLSFCPHCGQQNFTKAEESNARCGRCGRSSRINYSAPRYNLRLNISGVDQDAEFSEWSLSDLRDRVALIQDFDQLADDLRTEFLYLLDTYCVVTQEILVPQTVTLLQECAGS